MEATGTQFTFNSKFPGVFWSVLATNTNTVCPALCTCASETYAYEPDVEHTPDELSEAKHLPSHMSRRPTVVGCSAVSHVSMTTPKPVGTFSVYLVGVMCERHFDQ